MAWKCPKKSGTFTYSSSLAEKDGNNGMPVSNKQYMRADPDQVFRAFKKGFEIAETYWTFRSMYLSSAKQGANKSAAALATWVEDLVAQCEWLERERERRKAHRPLLSCH